ncbi:carbonic anhydrase family protein [Francisella salimarina]|uniref:carbonic anhydrase family protein n=1 Tax=Francisella salimarina TaxID=2599927 RepID=UPI003D81B4DA
MKNKFFLKAIFVASSVGMYSFGYSDSKPIEHIEHAHWGYLGSDGPEHWGELSSEYKECLNGKKQSPINIATTNIIKGTEADKIKINYHLHVDEIWNNGHTIQIQFKPGSYIFIGKQKYELKQMHFHTPSENYLDGKEFPFEAHFVNISKDGKIAVLGLLYEYNKKEINL